MAETQQMRSVFVGNIPYDATEDQMRNIFSSAGVVTNFRIVFDRDTGKPKGYGFCEYQDVETAQSAVRNFRNLQFNGRPLRIGFATGCQNNNNDMSGHHKNLTPEGQYGARVEPEMIHHAISKTVSSLPPEQMFELMKQMKLCIQNNPMEARNLLVNNPQLAYALLQAQVIMKIVDPKVALNMLHRTSDSVPFTQYAEQLPAQSNPNPTYPNPGISRREPMYDNPQIPINTTPVAINPVQANDPYVTRVSSQAYNKVSPMPGHRPNPIESNNSDVNRDRDPRIYRSHQGDRETIYRHSVAPMKRQNDELGPQPFSRPRVERNQNVQPEHSELLSRVLSMTEEEIRLLPVDQKQSIMSLRSSYHAK
ncbi:putative RNA-binding protein [Intoshia linei]|uniref:Putative RNA-binding protein n=1 Tax=Intoshia linei TaxID=1819745 RepID=A0A177BCE6_9BILA|nr:putative RNA-binding protein [Intoshia linei]